MLTTRALHPLRDLTQTINGILQTGRTSERVPVRGTSDPLDCARRAHQPHAGPH